MAPTTPPNMTRQVKFGGVRGTYKHLYTSIVVQEQSNHANKRAAACCGVDPPCRPAPSWVSLNCFASSVSMCLGEHRHISLSTLGDTIKMEYCRRIKIMHSSRILLKAQACLESSLLAYQDEFGPVYILMIIMDTAVFFSLRQQPKILICCTSCSCLPSQISGETVHKPIELVSLKVTN